MIFFAIGLAIALLAGWILIGLLKIMFGLLGGVLSWIFDR